MSKTQIFIEKARAVHGDRYDYDRVAYAGAHDKVIITCKTHGDFKQTPNSHLQGRGCAKCGLEEVAGKKKQKAKNSFIEKARTAHGGRYSYDRVVYVRARDKVIITCAKHGEFEQIPSSHLSGRGCPKCGFEEMAVKQSQESKNSFIERARAVHGDRYDYGRVAYVSSKEKVIITCEKHGDFEQRPNDHLAGQGCAKCGFESAGAKKTQKGKDGFIARARAAHGDRYSYDRVVYVRNSDKIIITCKQHGDFEQRPNDHFQGKGCAKCSFEEVATKLSQEARDGFIGKSRAVHGHKYDYSKTFYIRSKRKVIITCKEHGDFEQSPNNHLRGDGCPSCPVRYDQPANLYLMCNGLGKVKVGFSIDAGARLSQINRHAPFKAELVETWTLPDTPTVRKIESKVHRKLAKYHAGLSGFDGASEWFNTTPERAKGAILKALSGAEVLGHSEANSLQLALI